MNFQNTFHGRAATEAGELTRPLKLLHLRRIGDFYSYFRQFNVLILYKALNSRQFLNIRTAGSDFCTEMKFELGSHRITWTEEREYDIYHSFQSFTEKKNEKSSQSKFVADASCHLIIIAAPNANAGYSPNQIDLWDDAEEER